MGSISNPGISNLAQILAGSGSPALSAAISSPTVQSALQNAPAGEILQLSDQAFQLQETEGLFGTSDSSPETDLFSALSPSTGSTDLNSLLSTLQTSLSGAANSATDSSSVGSATSASTTDNSQQTGSNSSSNSSPLSDQLAAYQAALLAQQTQALFGIQPQADSNTNTLNLLA